jgi:hypothetical protein
VRPVKLSISKGPFPRIVNFEPTSPSSVFFHLHHIPTSLGDLSLTILVIVIIRLTGTISPPSLPFLPIIVRITVRHVSVVLLAGNLATIFDELQQPIIGSGT